MTTVTDDTTIYTGPDGIWLGGGWEQAERRFGIVDPAPDEMIADRRGRHRRARVEGRRPGRRRAAGVGGDRAT